MRYVSAELTLRPTRIGFLVRPADLRSVRKIMRYCTCVWGGIYNPIIPVFKISPIEWRDQIHRRFSGTEIAKGYIRFFEPDVYVESETGLLEAAGISALRESHTLHPQVITLEEFLQPEDGRDWSEPAFGLNIHDVFRHVYKTDRQFIRRETIESVIANPERGSALTESVFGVYPPSSDQVYIRKAYQDIYKPENASANPDTWRRVFLKGAETPLRATRHGLDV